MEFGMSEFLVRWQREGEDKWFEEEKKFSTYKEALAHTKKDWQSHNNTRFQILKVNFYVMDTFEPRVW
jgi:hypothetical protein